jgi:hypothetical protein
MPSKLAQRLELLDLPKLLAMLVDQAIVPAQPGRQCAQQVERDRVGRGDERPHGRLAQDQHPGRFMSHDECGGRTLVDQRQFAHGLAGAQDHDRRAGRRPQVHAKLPGQHEIKPVVGLIRLDQDRAAANAAYLAILQERSQLLDVHRMEQCEFGQLVRRRQSSQGPHASPHAVMVGPSRGMKSCQ